MLSDSRLQTIILTADSDRALPFYRDLLGLRFLGESHGSLLFSVGGSELRVSPVAQHQPSEHTAMGFAVSDLENVVRELLNKGLSMQRFEGFSHDDDGIMTTPWGSRVAWVKDPDGNLLSLVQFD